MTENIINNMSKLKWACRRGMLELDVLLGNFVNTGYSALSLEDKEQFVELLTHSDPELFDWLMGHSAPEDKELVKITEIIRLHARSRI